MMNRLAGLQAIDADAGGEGFGGYAIGGLSVGEPKEDSDARAAARGAAPARATSRIT
ncbi:hypothetical protein ACU4HD_46705 [Cupriavidus basilensis]